MLWLVSGAVALMAGLATPAAGDDDWACQLRCEADHAHRRAECAAMFEEGDPLAEDCLEAAYVAYWRCLRQCIRFWLAPSAEIATRRQEPRGRPRQPAET